MSSASEIALVLSPCENLGNRHQDISCCSSMSVGEAVVDQQTNSSCFLLVCHLDMAENLEGECVIMQKGMKTQGLVLTSITSCSSWQRQECDGLWQGPFYSLPQTLWFSFLMNWASSDWMSSAWLGKGIERNGVIINWRNGACIYEKATNIVILTSSGCDTVSSSKKPEIVFSHISCNQ